MRSGDIATSWKTGKLVLFKKPGKTENVPSAYRPICLLSTVWKLLECLVANRIEDYLETRNEISNDQYGFRRGKSTVLAPKHVCDVALREKQKTLKTRKFVH